MGFALVVSAAMAAEPSEGAVEAGSRSALTVAYWAPVGASVRFDRHVAAGISVLFDAAAGVRDADDLDSATPDELLAENVVRGLAGFNFAKGPGLRGAYVGLRGGAEGHVGETLELHTGIVEFVLGRRWIAVHGLTLQLGGGVAARIPLGVGPMPETLVPIGELRVGLANTK
jgi:hypothetical protein